MSISRRSLLSALPLLPVGRLLRGQSAPAADPNAKFSADVRVVNVLATVRDKKGQIVKGLTQADFTLTEDGEPQTIRYFSQESDLPMTLGLLVDTSGSERNNLAGERSASRRFFEQVLQENRDQAFVIHFDSEVELLQDLTGSRPKLETALDELVVRRPQLQRQPDGGNGGGGYPGGGYPRRGGGGAGRRGGTMLYDAVLLASDELMAKQKGRKAVIVLSDGVDRGSKVTLADAIRSAQQADTLVYAILFADVNEGNPFGGFGQPGRRRGGLGGGGYPGGGYPRGGDANRPDGKKIMTQMAQETGGRFFEVSHKEPIEKIYTEIEEDLRNEYSIGYTPERAADGGYRHIQLTTTKKDLKVQAREGYYPK